MIATVSPSASQYHHTLNTLKYANRAKEIKTHVRRNQGTVQEHVSRLRAQILALQRENVALRAAQQTPMVIHPIPVQTLLHTHQEYAVCSTELVAFLPIWKCSARTR